MNNITVYETKKNETQSAQLKLVVNHKNKTIEVGYYITHEKGLLVTSTVLNQIASDLLYAGYEEK